MVLCYISAVLQCLAAELSVYVRLACSFDTCLLSAGVNPMITTESIAYTVGEGIAARCQHLAGKRRQPVDIKYDD